MIRVKVCGITNLSDALLSSRLGAHAIGFIFYKGSKRYIEPEKAKEITSKLPPFLLKVGVFVNEEEEDVLRIVENCGLDRVQIYNDPDLEYIKIPKEKIIKAIRVKDIKDIERANNCPYFPLLDTFSDKEYGGTGKSFNWELLSFMKRDYILAGGINISNLEPIMGVRPYAIDVSSGLESKPGVKDEKKMFEFFSFLRQNQG